MKNITMKDIADSLQISTVTVSKALSDKEGVGPALREKIKQTAEEMGYRYNSLAKGMKEGKSYNIGVLVADRYVLNEADAFYLKMYQNVVKALSKSNYYGIMEIVSAKAEQELIIPNIVSDNKVDGVIILGQMKQGYLEAINKINVPLVFLDFYNNCIDVDSVISDSFYGAYILTNHMISLGHKDIGFVGNIYSTSSILDRYLGFYKALITNKLELNDDWVIKDRGEDGAYIDFVLPDKLPTAFICNCDSVAYLFIKKLKKLGYKVPDDISVAGFDNYVYANLSSPKLTTVEVDMETMSETAVNAVMSKLQGVNNIIGRRIISGNLVIRDSVKKIEG